jgi:predicted DNA-binding transcriptional regulator AlpA
MSDSKPRPATLRPKDVAALLDIGERSLSRYVQSGAFPQPIRLGRSLRWSEQAVREWIDSRSREGGAR